MLVQSKVQVKLSWDSPFLQRYPQDNFQQVEPPPQPHSVLAQPSHSGFHTATQKRDTLSVLEELKTELKSSSSFISLSWSTVASVGWALSKATIHSIAYVLPAAELHRNAMRDSDIYLFVIYFQTNGNSMNSFLGFQGHMPFMLDPERVMVRNVKLLIYLTASFNPPAQLEWFPPRVSGGECTFLSKLSRHYVGSSRWKIQKK